MNVNIVIKYSTNKHSFLCFGCAVKFSLAGHEISTDAGDYDSEYYMGSTWCEHPAIEQEQEEEQS